MAKQPISLGGSDRDFNSVKARQGAVNLLPEIAKDGQYATVKDSFGLTLLSTLTDFPGRSNLFVNSGFMYCVSGATLFRVDEFGVATALGVVNGSGRAQIFANGAPGDNQIMILNGIGQGFVYTNGAGLVQITDPNFFATVSGTVLNERGIFVRRDTNEFFLSDVTDFAAYNPLSFGSAEQNPDNLRAAIKKNSGVWFLNTESIEFWQSVDSATLPLRVVTGASKERGIAADASLAKAGEVFCWFADDNTVRVIDGQQMTTISGLDFELKVRGDGTPNFPGFSVTDDAIGFFIDGPAHKIYCLTFPTEGFTWAYDFATQLEHTRQSEGLGFWRVGAAALFNNKLYGLDIVKGLIYELDQGAKDENGEIMRRVLTLPSISFPVDWTLPHIEFEMEVGQTTDPTANPVMIVEYSKDGGYTYRAHSSISLGDFGEHAKRVVLRQFGRIVRHKDFILRLTITDATRFQAYNAFGDIELDG